MTQNDGASPIGDRATDASHEAPAGLRHTVGIPSAALTFLAEIVVPVLEDVLEDEEGSLDAAEAACDADGVCSSRWCQSGGCIVDKLRFARRIVEMTGGDAAGWEAVQGYVRWQHVLGASAGEAGTAATVKQGAVHEHATAESGDAHD